MSLPDDFGQDGGSTVYAEFFTELQKGQEDRKASIEQRGLAVVTTSGALVSLLFGLVALITQADEFDLPKASHGPLALGLLLFVLAAALALITNLPWRYRNISPVALTRVLDRYWADSKSDAEMRVAATQEKIFARAQTINEAKAWALVIALLAEVGAVCCVAISVAEVLKAS